MGWWPFNCFGKPATLTRSPLPPTPPPKNTPPSQEAQLPRPVTKTEASHKNADVKLEKESVFPPTPSPAPRQLQTTPVAHTSQFAGPKAKPPKRHLSTTVIDLTGDSEQSAASSPVTQPDRKHNPAASKVQEYLLQRRTNAIETLCKTGIGASLEDGRLDRLTTEELEAAIAEYAPPGDDVGQAVDDSDEIIVISPKVAVKRGVKRRLDDADDEFAAPSKNRSKRTATSATAPSSLRTTRSQALSSTNASSASSPAQQPRKPKPHSIQQARTQRQMSRTATSTTTAPTTILTTAPTSHNHHSEDCHGFVYDPRAPWNSVAVKNSKAIICGPCYGHRTRYHKFKAFGGLKDHMLRFHPDVRDTQDAAISATS